MPQDKEAGMASFKSQFPEHTTKSRERMAPAPAPLPAPAPVPAPSPFPAPATASAFSFAAQETIESPEERQAIIGEAVLGVLADNPSLSLKEAMQHPKVRIAAGEPAVPPAPVLPTASLYSAEVGVPVPSISQRRMQLAAIRQRRRQLQRLRLQQQIRQAAAAREALLAQQQQQQQEASLFPGHSVMGDVIDSEINKRLYSSGIEYPFARQLPIDPHQTYEQPHPFNANNPAPTEQSYQFPYQKQGTEYNPSYTHRTLGPVQMANQQPAPALPTTSVKESSKFGFKENSEFLKARENRYGKYYLGPWMLRRNWIQPFC